MSERAPEASRDAVPAVEASELTIGFGEHVLLERISFRVEQGESFAILGRSGSGKSTLLRHLLGLDTPQGGSVRLGGRDPREEQTERPSYGAVFQHGSLLASMTLVQNVALPLEQWTALEPAAVDAVARAKLALVGLQGSEQKLPDELSGGMRRRGAIARALALEPSLLFLDEPSAGLDPPTARGIDHLLDEINRELGTALILITHELDSVFALAERCVVIDDRRRGIVAEGDPRELRDRGPADVRDFLRRGAGRSDQRGAAA